MENAACAAGIDVGKSFLDVGMAPSGHTFRVPNGSEGIRTLLRRLSRSRPQRVVLEAIGPYAAPLISGLRDRGFEVGVVNPRRIKAFRDAEGRRAKTDKLDASLIARFALTMSDTVRPLPSQAQLALKALATRRHQLVEMIAMEKTRLKQAIEPMILESHRATIKTLTADRKKVEQEIARRIALDPALVRRKEILTSIPGVGEHVATALITDLPELGTTDRRSIASLAGLAPHPNQSGASVGRAQISGGRPCVRTALYIAGLVSTRVNPAARTAYKAMRNDGKPAKVAIVAAARKLLVTANALVKSDNLYDPARFNH
jgi:transposase